MMPYSHSENAGVFLFTSHLLSASHINPSRSFFFLLANSRWTVSLHTDFYVVSYQSFLAVGISKWFVGSDRTENPIPPVAENKAGINHAGTLRRAQNGMVGVTGAAQDLVGRRRVRFSCTTTRSIDTTVILVDFLADRDEVKSHRRIGASSSALLRLLLIDFPIIPRRRSKQYS